MAGTALLALNLASVSAAGDVTTTPSPTTPADSIWLLIVIIAIPFDCCAFCLCSADDEGDHLKVGMRGTDGAHEGA